MIPVARELVGEPAILGRPYDRGRNKGKSELDLVLAALESHRAAGEPDDDFSFSFSRYKENEVRSSLEQLFHGKCAYCEQRYAGTQPMDVEHWRPKGEVHFVDRPKQKPGYYWLAATWTNLLPSCIDCNRSRYQLDVVTREVINLGKANQFPLVPGTDPVSHHGDDLSTEQPLLVNPCEDEPDEHFEWNDEGVMFGRTSKGAASIRVYALNRSELVRDRRAVLRLLEYRLTVLEFLAPILANIRQETVNDPLDLQRALIEDLVAFEVRSLVAMTEPAEPFAGMVRFVLLREVPFLVGQHDE